MMDERKIAFDNISRMLAIIRYDIEHHQVINDLSLNIHGENYFRDIFNFVYGCNFENANFETQNAPCIDLIDKSKKVAYQITTTRTKAKINKTLAICKDEKYKNYEIRIFYLLEKAKPNKNIVAKLCDYTDLIKDIENLETNKIIELNERYFRSIAQRYTDEIALDLIFKKLIQEKKRIKPRYDDSFGSVDTDKKITINGINDRIKSEINRGLDYTKILEDINNEDNLLNDLRALVVDDWYKQILTENLKSNVSKKELYDLTIIDLHNVVNKYGLDFNKIIGNLHESIECNIEINDFNTMNIAWIVIAYFFEICDIGVHQS